MDKKTYILSQYANSPRLVKLLQGIEESFSLQEDITNFYNNIFNIETAQGYGLDVWGERLNIPRQLKITIDNTEDLYTLPDKYYRLLLLTKAISNISNCTVPNLEELLNFLFKDRGKVYVFDTDTMVMRYIFTFFLNAYEVAFMKLPGIPPKPTGVELFIQELPPTELFGFNDTGFQPFDQKPFRP